MVDFSAPFNALIAQNQQPAPNPLATAAQAVQLQTGMANSQRAVAEADDAALANAQNHMAFITQAMTPLLAKGANVTANDVAAAGADAVATSKGRISPQEIAQFIGTLPTDGPGIQQALQQHQLRLIDAQNQIRLLRGENSDVQTGGGTQFGLRNSFTGQRAPQAGPNGYVPNEPGVGLTEGPSIQTPSGPQATRMTLRQAYDIAQNKASVVGGQIVYRNGQQQAAPAPAAGASASPAGAGTVPVGPAPPIRGPLPTPTGQLLPVGAPAGAAGAADFASQDSARQGQALLAAADGVPQTRSTIDNMKALLPKFTPGPNAAGINRFKAGANELADTVAPGVGPRFDQQSIAAQEEFHKQAEMLAQQSFAALGGTGTDKQLASAHGSNPNDALSGLGNAQILPMLEGLQDAVQAKAAAWQKYRQQNGDASYGAFQTDFNQNFSPRAFQFVRMSPAQRQELVGSMTPAEKAQLGSALQNAEQRGYINPPSR